MTHTGERYTKAIQASRGPDRRKDSFQAFLVRHPAENQTFDVLIDDDRSGEAADLVGIRVEGGHLHVVLVHCKYSVSFRYLMTFMRVLFIGAGTMGLTHGWLLAAEHEVTWFVRDSSAAFYEGTFELHVHDLRRGCHDTTRTLRPRLVSQIEADAYDIVLVMVPSTHLVEVLALLAPVVGRTRIVFMLNHWNLPAVLSTALVPGSYLVGFPSQIGGGRQGHRIDVTVFPHGTVLESDTSDKRAVLADVESLFTSVGLSVRRQRRMTDWLAVHSLQQSLTAAPVIEAGSYEAFCADTTAMVTGHMRHGLTEWIDGLKAIHADARRLGLTTPEIDHQHEVVTAI